MKILIDLTFINSLAVAQNSLSIYTYRFINHIPTTAIPNIALFVHHVTGEYIKKKFPSFHIIKQEPVNGILSQIPILKSLCYQKKWKKDIDSLNFDVVFIPYAVAKNSPRTKSKKVIVIHDLRQLRISDNKHIESPLFKILGLTSIYYQIIRYYFKQHINNAIKIITISNYVKNDVLNNWHSAIEKVEVVYNGIPQGSDISIQPGQLNESERYILYVNNLLPYKNLITLIKAFELIKDPNIKLVIVGKQTDYWNNIIKPYISNSKISERIIYLSYVSDEELNWLYTHATLFVTPSLNEGFGYTPIEAAIRMCPVISSQCESLPDVTANKLFYYSPPTNAASLANEINKILSNYPSREYLKEISEFFQKRYDPNKQTEQILSILTNNDSIDL